MDAKLFRLPTNPNFYAGISVAHPFKTEERQKYSQLPTPDSRFPGWAAPMADGRLVTSYMNHCSQNIAPGSQYATKEWMVRGASDIIRVSRERLSIATGAVYGTADTVPPAATTVQCTAGDCVMHPTGKPGGIGVERAGAAAPELFGTWDPRQVGAFTAAPGPRVSLTRKYEGGRNTPRGGEMA